MQEYMNTSKRFPKKPIIRKLGTISCNNIVETTPLVYVLDDEKRIIAKKIRAKQIPLLLPASLEGQP